MPAKLHVRAGCKGGPAAQRRCHRQWRHPGAPSVPGTTGARERRGEAASPHKSWERARHPSRARGLVGRPAAWQHPIETAQTVQVGRGTRNAAGGVPAWHEEMGAPHGPSQARRWAHLQTASMRAVPARAAWMAAPGPGAAGGAATARGRARSQPRQPGPAPSCQAAAERDGGRGGRGSRGAAGGRGGGSGRGGERRCAWARFEHGALHCNCPCLPAAMFDAPSSTSRPLFSNCSAAVGGGALASASRARQRSARSPSRRPSPLIQ